MIQVELALYKKKKEYKRVLAANKNNNQSSKFSLPKHQPTELTKQQPMRGGGMEIETGFVPLLLTSNGVNYKP